MANKREPHEIEQPSRTDEEIKGTGDDEFEDVDEADDDDEEMEEEGVEDAD